MHVTVTSASQVISKLTALSALMRHSAASASLITKQSTPSSSAGDAGCSLDDGRLCRPLNPVSSTLPLPPGLIMSIGGMQRSSFMSLNRQKGHVTRSNSSFTSVIHAAAGFHQTLHLICILMGLLRNMTRAITASGACYPLNCFMAIIAACHFYTAGAVFIAVMAVFYCHVIVCYGNSIICRIAGCSAWSDRSAIGIAE